MAKTYYALLKERHGSAYSDTQSSWERVIEYTSRLDHFHLVDTQPMPPAHARNRYCQLFYYKTKDPDPNDTLVMLDADHLFDKDIVERLAAHDKGVVGALAVARGDTPFVCFFKRGEDKNLYNLTEWEPGELVEGTVVGTGVIAIKRWVLTELADKCAPSWFRYEYGKYLVEPTEDMYFGYECEAKGIPHYCDTSLVIPHASVVYATPDHWKEWLELHPEVRPKFHEVPRGNDESPS